MLRGPLPVFQVQGKALVQDPLMCGLLIDQHQARFDLRDDIAVVQLHQLLLHRVKLVLRLLSGQFKCRLFSLAVVCDLVQ
ncbi:hypothetical protein D3C87_1623690 [compost metagenome]